MNAESVYVVNPKLKLATEGDVAAAERALKTQFPAGYAAFVTTLGEGSYCDAIRIYAPQRIVKENDEFRARLKEYFFWEEGANVLSKERVVESICIADTVNGDELIFHPENPAKLYVLPYEAEVIYPAGSTFDEALDWMLNCGELVDQPASRYFDSGVGAQTRQLVPIKRRPTFARMKTSLLKLGPDHVEEPTKSGRSQSLKVFFQSLGGSILCTGRAQSYAVFVRYSSEQPCQALDLMLTRLEELGFVPPEDDEGKPHPALAALLPNYFTFDGIVPWAVPPSERAPREIVLNFIRAMHVWETGLIEWGGAGYPGPMAHELIYDILAEFGLPKEKGDDLCYSNPSNYHPETATIAEETTLSTDKAQITTRGNDPFDTEHTFVLARQDQIWKLQEVWMANRFHKTKTRVL